MLPMPVLVKKGMRSFTPGQTEGPPEPIIPDNKYNRTPVHNLLLNCVMSLQYFPRGVNSTTYQNRTDSNGCLNWEAFLLSKPDY